MGFILLASLLYLGRFDGGLSTWLWFGGLPSASAPSARRSWRKSSH
jgi:hypothetical protein